MPTAEEALAALFADRPVVEQKALLARLERAAAVLYPAWAAAELDRNAKMALEGAAAREEQNALVLESLS